MKSARTQNTDRPMSALAAAMWTIGLLLLEPICLGVTDALRPGAATDMVNIAACELLATSIVVLGILRAYAPESSVRRAIGARAIAMTDVIAAALAGAGLSPPLSALDDLVTRRWPYDAASVERMEKLVSGGPRATLVIAALVVLPLADELFYRGVLFEQLRRSFSSAMTVAMTAVFFACSSEWRLMPSTLILGVAFSYMRAHGGSVLASMIASLAFGAVSGVPILAGRDPLADVTYPPKWIAAGAIAALVSLLVFARRREKAS
jgi:membrane protease YdiL (CAAX protease family)